MRALMLLQVSLGALNDGRTLSLEELHKVHAGTRSIALLTCVDCRHFNSVSLHIMQSAVPACMLGCHGIVPHACANQAYKVGVHSSAAAGLLCSAQQHLSVPPPGAARDATADGQVRIFCFSHVAL